MHLSYSEWAAELDNLCKKRLGKSITQIPQVKSIEMEQAYNDDVTPEEFYTVDVVCEVTYGEPFGGTK
jgi:hypothetical protein